MGIAWLELLVDFVAATAVFIPKQRGEHRGYHYEPCGIGLFVDDFKTQLVVFRSCIKLIGALLPRPIYPQERSNQCPSQDSQAADRLQD